MCRTKYYSEQARGEVVCQSPTKSDQGVTAQVLLHAPAATAGFAVATGTMTYYLDKETHMKDPSPHLRGRLARRPEHRTLRGSIPAPAEPILVDLRFPCNKYPFSFSRKDLSTVCTVAEPTPPLS